LRSGRSPHRFLTECAREIDGKEEHIVSIVLYVLGGLILAIALYDVLQRKHAILRNFPVIGHMRYLLEAIGPELRQYIVTDNDEERPFSRDQRRWIYASAKKQNRLFGFGTDNDLELSPNYLVIRHATFPKNVPNPGEAGYDPDHLIPCAKVMGAARGRRHAFRPRSIIGISAMSYGSLSGRAVQALNRGAMQAGALHNTGEGGVSDHHRQGGDLVWQIGTGYFGCRDLQGNFSLEKLKETVAKTPTLKAIEIKLSQGAKPGAGGILPAEKITPEISAIRGIPMGQTCFSPSAHTAFSNEDELLDLVELIAEETGLPVGIKSAVGEMVFWDRLAEQMLATDRGVDFITIDGGEGGTGAAPLSFSDHVSMPFKLGFSRVYRLFHEKGLADDIVFIGSGKLGFPEATLFAFALGCDMVSVAREAMIAIGCIQAQRCHNNHCPTGVATQNKWLTRGLDPESKGERAGNYLITHRMLVDKLVRAMGKLHPALVTADELEVLNDRFESTTVADVFGYAPGMGRPSQLEAQEVERILAEAAAIRSRSA
jgi:glutamate synthase domain-containing protein 2